MADSTLFAPPPEEPDIENEPELPIHGMAARHVGLTQALAEAYLEAASVCLARFHQSPSLFQVQGRSSTPARVSWEPPDERVHAAWANEIDTTECGAYACALAGLELSEGLVAVSRAEHGTGADYYVSQLDSALDDLEEAVRFEVSGLSEGSEAAVAARLADKLNQAKRGQSNLPAMAGVVGFRARLILLARMAES